MSLGLLFILLTSAFVSAQHHALYKCPAMLSIQNFYPDRFLGRWYIHRQFRVGAEQEMDCKTITLREDGSVAFDFTARGKPFTVSGNFLVDASADGIMKATFDYSDVMGSQANGEVIWYILGTDYDSFAILAACEEEAIMHKQYVYFLSRDPEPSIYQKALMDVTFMNAHFPKGGSLTYQSHDSCSPDTIVIDSPKQDSQTPKPAQSESTRPVETTRVESSSSAPEPQVSDNLVDANQQLEQELEAVIQSEATNLTPAQDESSNPPGITDPIPAANHYEEIDLTGIPLIDGADSRLAHLINRMRLSRNFVEWREIVDEPVVKPVITRNYQSRELPARKKPHFLKLAIRQ